MIIIVGNHMLIIYSNFESNTCKSNLLLVCVSSEEIQLNFSKVSTFGVHIEWNSDINIWWFSSNILSVCDSLLNRPSV